MQQRGASANQNDKLRKSLFDRLRRELNNKLLTGLVCTLLRNICVLCSMAAERQRAPEQVLDKLEAECLLKAITRATSDRLVDLSVALIIMFADSLYQHCKVRTEIITICNFHWIQELGILI
jgi:hypothetical protein